MIGAVLLMLLLPFAAGAAIASCFGLRPTGNGPLGGGMWAAWSWTLGALATALVVFAWMWTPLAKDAWFVPGAALALIAASGFALGRRVDPVPIDPPMDPGSNGAPAWERAVFGLVVAGALALMIQRVLAGDAVPVFGDDEANFWALKAKLIHQAGGLNADFSAALEDPHYLYHRDYPLLNPLLQLWAFACAGEITHVVNRLPIQMFSIALVPAMACALMRVTRPGVAAALIAMVVSCTATAHQARTMHSDLMVAFGVALALDAWLRMRAPGSSMQWFRLAAIALALAAFAKGEGSVFLLAIAIAWPLARLAGLARVPVRGLACAWLLVPVAILALTWSVNAHFGFTNDIAMTEGRDETFLAILFGEANQRIPFLLDWLGDDLVFERGWAAHLPWLFLLTCGLVGTRMLRDDLGFAALAIVGVATGFVMILLGTPHDPEWHLPTALPRITWQLVPVTALWIGAAAGRFLPGLAPIEPGADVR